MEGSSDDLLYVKKVYGMNWTCNKSKIGGAQNEVIKNAGKDDVILVSDTQKNGRMWGATSPDNLLKLIETNKGLYEVIARFPHKVYFDIDEECDGSNYTEEQKEAHLFNTLGCLEEFFPNCKNDVAVSGSYTEKKISYHIILNNYIINNEDERQTMKTIAKYIKNASCEGMDWKVYTKNRNMKIINQSKRDGRVQEIIKNVDWKKHLITCYVTSTNSVINPFPKIENLKQEVKEEIMIEKSKGTFDLANLPKMVLKVPDNFDINYASPLELLSMMPIGKDYDHTYTHLVARFCNSNGLTLEHFWSWIQKKHKETGKDLNIEYQKWSHHFSNLGKYPPVTEDRLKSILYYYYPHLKKDKTFRDFQQTFILPTENIKKIETIIPATFQTDDKYLVYNIGMGGGKTAQSISYLSKCSDFIWIAPNKALASNTKKRFEDENVDVSHYLEFKTKDKKQGELNNVNKLICVINSLHYIKEKNYDVIIIDEIETLLDKFQGDFMEQGKLQLKKPIWEIFKKIIINAKKVIFLDAFITSKTINFIKNLEENAKMVIYERLNEPQTRTIKYRDDFHDCLSDIIQKLKDGQKLFIFYPYKKDTRDYRSMEAVYKTICKSSGKQGAFYNADVDDKKKKDIKDVNASWKNLSFVMTNNIITCGVNYEIEDFDYKYLFIAPFNTPRDIIQVSYRARHLSTGIINICYMGMMNQPNTWENDCKKMECGIYNKLYKDILIEKKAPLKRSFQLFCIKAHYKQEVEPLIIDESITKDLKKTLTDQQVGFSYDVIEDLDNSQAEYIEQKCLGQDATLYDKLCLKKYYYQKKFLDADAEELETIWDNDMLFFFDKLERVFLSEDNIFKKIQKLNNLETIFPNDIKKTKLDDDIKAQIFTEFSFKFITDKSSTAKILKEIYNTYFAKHIIITLPDGNKHTTYMYNENLPDVKNLYKFGLSNRIINNDINLTYADYLLMDNENPSCVDI